MDCLGSPTTKSLPGSSTTRRHASASGSALAEEEDDLRLERIGVLELVDQEIAEAPLQQSSRVAIREEQVAQAAEEVGEVEAPQSELGRAGPARERVRDGDGEAGEVLRVGVAKADDRRRSGLVAAPELVLAAPPLVPVALASAEAARSRLDLEAAERRHRLVRHRRAAPRRTARTPRPDPWRRGTRRRPDRRTRSRRTRAARRRRSREPRDRERSPARRTRW